MEVAPASRAALTTSAMSSGLSEMPGRIGAIPTPASIPASRNRESARSRCAGGGVFGSVSRQMRSSSVGTENVTETFAFDAASTSTSMSRTTIGPRVMIDSGFAASARTSRHARVSR
jgi:hypothetical protein